jgi:hypothetical protein
VTILLEDRKAKIVGRSRCRVAWRLARSAATADDVWQHGAEININKATLDIPLSCTDMVAQPLLDLGQGKRECIGLTAEFPMEGAGVGEIATTKTESDGADGSDGGNDHGTTEIIGNANSVAGALHPRNSRESIRASDTHPLLNCVNLRASEITPPPPGEKGTINKVATPPRGEEANHKGTAQWGGKGTTAHTSTCLATLEGLRPPVLEPSGQFVTGANTNKLWLQNKRRRHQMQEVQVPTSWWTTHTGEAVLPPHRPWEASYCNEMCPARPA